MGQNRTRPGIFGKKSKMLGMGRLGHAPGRKQLPGTVLPARPPPFKTFPIAPKMPPIPPPKPPEPPPKGSEAHCPSTQPQPMLIQSKVSSPVPLISVQTCSNPNGSLKLTGFPPTYGYRFKDCGFPKSMLPEYGSGERKRPWVLEYWRKGVCSRCSQNRERHR